MLTPPSDPERSARTATTVRTLTAAGQWDAAETLVRSALAVPLPAPDSAALGCALSSLLALTGRATEAMIEAQAVLATFDITPGLRDDATIALLWAWVGLRGNRQVDQLARAILAEPGAKRGEVVIAAMVAFAMAAWDAGRPTEALDLVAQAARKAAEGPYETTHFNPQLLLAARLIDCRPGRRSHGDRELRGICRGAGGEPVAGGNRRGHARPDRPGDGPARRRGGARPVGLGGDECPRACRA